MGGFTINYIGVIGSGQMGSGIAHVAATTGIQVKLYDIDATRIQAAIAGIGKNMDRQIAKNSLTAEAKEEALKRITAIDTLDAFADSDLVIEAATENESIKKEIFGKLKGKLKPEALLASNTSSISITRLASATDRAEQFIGMHFMNPVPVMKLVEIIKGLATSEATFNAVNNLAQSMGKITAIANDLPGFIVNRILLPMINEAVYALYESVGNVESIDTAMKLGSNQPMGPLELADFIGLDTCLAIMQVLHHELGDSKYRPCPLLVKYVEAGWLGRKSGRGFYVYGGEKPVPTR
ncbi:MAG: 3-hydroxybutyryl-CoA dehydrogenase [Alphaproteobacteria bacterium]